MGELQADMQEDGMNDAGRTSEAQKRKKKARNIEENTSEGKKVENEENIKKQTRSQTCRRCRSNERKAAWMTTS